MTLNLNVPQTVEQLTPRITVIGVGGAGGNAVNNMIQNNLEGVEFLVTNTDSQALAQTLAERSIQLGRNVTQGLGAGSRPDIGRAAAEEVLDDLLTELDGSNMIFVTAGMGGGTGTGAAPVIARAAREAGILTVGVVTKPFHFEGVHRMRLAESGIQELQQYVDTLIIIPNQNLFRVANEKTTFADAFKMADDVLDSGVRGVTDLMIMPGLINLDFADIRAVMSEMGKAMMGTGEAESDNRAIEAAEAAISNPLLDDVSMKGARGVLINITGGSDMTLFEVDEAANRIRDEVDAEANIIFGSTFVQSMEGRMRVSVVATGIDADQIEAPRPKTLSLVSDRSAAGMGTPGTVNAPGDIAAASMQSSVTVEDRPSQQAAAAEAPTFDHEEPEAAPMPAGQQDEPDGVDRAAAAAGFDQRIRSEAAPEPFEPATSDPGPEPGEVREPAERADGFMAPPPVETEVRNPLYSQPSIQRETAMETQPARSRPQDDPRDSRGAVGLGRKKAQSFLARVSGAARAIQSVTQSAEPSAVARQEPRHQSAPIAAAPAAAVTTHQDPAEQIRQPHLAGLDPAERAPAGAPDDELLDIPAFLRRQAN